MPQPGLGVSFRNDVLQAGSVHHQLSSGVVALLMQVQSAWTAAAFLGVAGVCFPEQLLSGALELMHSLQNTSSNLQSSGCGWKC